MQRRLVLYDRMFLFYTNLIIKCRIGYAGYFPFVQGEKF
ncbi:hypothetical protein SAMN05444285_12261 [Draconibacterium orientale]|jgi:hypothetical protein|uniref:Uncharacterized protein n=1 Tax=Draconibacterium orientale TaxID=1168034 RepID=A0A1I0GYL4_9BACT|nr:hypothetical protein SAMN05444285_12261 [Draconibacterium orientale]